jgi:glycosyltransferase involved in cell wall biosynthesis
MKKVVVSVINDLSSDQRVHKVCLSLHAMGFKVLLVGRRQRTSLPLNERRYHTRRMFLLFERGPLFYASFQCRLFFLLLFKKQDLLVANDLDTLLPNFLISKLKGIPLVYDTHELFCEVPELAAHPLKKKIWKKLESALFPRLKDVFTVNDSISEIYEKEYKVPVNVVRNLPRLNFSNLSAVPKSRKELGLPEGKKIILMQGAGINVDRGAEEALTAMQFLEDALLLIIGGGDVIGKLKEMAKAMNLSGKVWFIGKLPFQELKSYTLLADLGLTLDKDSNINYRYSLPNKLFDYIQAGVPVLASDLVEVKKVVDQYQVGCITTSLEPKHLAAVLSDCLNNDARMKQWKENCRRASQELCWESEEEVLRNVYRKFL